MGTVDTVRVVVCSTFLAAITTVQAQSSLQASADSLRHSAEAIGLAVGASAQVISGVAAIPLGLSASVGNVSGEVSAELWRVANTPIGTPLPVSDALVTVGPPPGEALRQSSE